MGVSMNVGVNSMPQTEKKEKNTKHQISFVSK